VYIFRAVLRIQLKMFDDALQDLAHAEFLSEESDDTIYSTRAQCFYAMGQYDSALREIGAAIEISENHWNHYFYRGLIRYRLNDTEGCHEDIKKVQEHKGPSGSIDHLMSLLDRQRRFAELVD